MKKLLFFGVVGVLAYSAVAFSQTTTLWEQSSATGNLPTWFNTSNEQRNFAFGNVGGKDHLYVTYASPSLLPVLILDAATGDSIGTLDTTGISGGTFVLDDIETSSDGVIFAGNLTVNAKSSPFKVYKWTSESVKPTQVISYADSSYRLGDHFTVTGSTADNSVTIWVAATGGGAVVKFTTTDYGATFTPTVIALGARVGATPKVYPTSGGDFFVSSAGVGINEYDATGNLIGSVASIPITMGSMGYIDGGSPVKAYVFGYNYSNAQGSITPQFVQVVDVTNGISTADSVASTPVLGTTLNANGTGDIALKDNGDGTVTIFVLATNNGIGAFTFNAWQVPQPQSMTAIWQESSATGDLPTWFNTSNEQRNLAYANEGGKDHLYVTYAAGKLSPILILDAATGDSIGTLDTTGITGGTFVLDDIEASSDGVIFAGNLTVNAKSNPFKVYKWTSESAKPVDVISYADSSYRLGDHFTVTGSTADNSVTIWVAATGGSDVVKFTTTDYGSTFTPTVIPLGSSIGSTPKVCPMANGDFFISSAGDGIKEYDASGNYLGTVSAMPMTAGGMGYITGGSPAKAYVFGYDYTNSPGTAPQFVEAVDVTSGISTADSVASSPVLGTTANGNGTGDIALKSNSDGSVTVYVMSTNNGIGAYAFNANLTAVVHRGAAIPSRYVLSQNYPNPFNPTTQIDYSVPRNGFVTLKVYNVLGQEVATLFSGSLKAGSYTATFDASRLASGVYFYRIDAGSFSSVKKMVLLK